MKLNEFLSEAVSVEALKAQLKELHKELIAAKSGGNDDHAEQLGHDIADAKERIKNAEA